MVKQENIQARIPASNKWHTEDLEAKAAKLGMNKSQLILMATNLFMYLNAKEVDDLRVFADARRLVTSGLNVNYSITLTAKFSKDDQGGQR